MPDKAMTPAQVQHDFAVVGGPFSAGTAFNFFNVDGAVNYIRIGNNSDKILYFKFGYEASPSVSATDNHGFVPAGQCVQWQLATRDEENFPTINYVQLFLTAAGTPATPSVTGW